MKNANLVVVINNCYLIINDIINEFGDCPPIIFIAVCSWVEQIMFMNFGQLIFSRKSHKPTQLKETSAKIGFMNMT